MARPGSRRALRRHHRARVIRARERQYHHVLGSWSGAGDDPWITSPRRRGALAHTSFFRLCSCGLCASPPAPRPSLVPRWWETSIADALPSRAGHRRMPDSPPAEDRSPAGSGEHHTGESVSGLMFTAGNAIKIVVETAKGGAMDAETVARRMLGAFNDNDWEAFRSLISDDFRYREHGTSREATGAGPAMDLITPWKEALGPGHHGELVGVVAGGDRVALQVVWRGKHVGPMPAPDGSIIAPTDVDVATPACMAMTVEDGHITEMDHYFDSLVLMLSIGGVAAGAAV